MPEYRVEDLARLAGTTTRNIRAYRERGLLAPPRLAGRTGWYDDSHLARLRLITRLLERGYSLANIGELFTAWESGRPVTEVLGIEQVLSRPLSADEPWVGSRDDAAALVGVPAAQVPWQRLVELGLIAWDGEQVVVQVPRLLRIAGELVSRGLPLDTVVDLAAGLLRLLDQVARHLVMTVNDTLYAPRSEPTPVAEFEADMTAMLQLADEAVTRVFRWSLERQLAGELGRSVERRFLDAEVVV
jgi:DNA-binding transcriptional MerR regulator